ncbi:MAG: metallophosphoesterase [Phycisphaerae bacterium]
MRIGVVSDTHDRLPTLERALAILRHRRIDVVLHPGDIIAPFAARRLAAFEGRVYVTYGNNDGERDGLRSVLPQIQDGPLMLELGGRRILMHHFIDWCAPDDVARADVVVTGHTHEVCIERRDGRLFLNPGECCGWVTGRCTFAVLDPTTLETELIEVPT